MSAVDRDICSEFDIENVMDPALKDGCRRISMIAMTEKSAFSLFLLQTAYSPPSQTPQVAHGPKNQELHRIHLDAIALFPLLPNACVPAEESPPRTFDEFVSFELPIIHDH